MTIAEINALLYSSNHARDRLERALLIEALSPDGAGRLGVSAGQMTAASGNAGLAPAAAHRLHQDFGRSW
jgi:hypothetical protein